MRFFITIGFPSILLLGLGMAASATPIDNHQTDRQTIARWVRTLESDTYSARHSATEKLILAGPLAIQPVAEAVEVGGLETIIRGIYVLRQLALTAEHPDTEAAAYGALHKIAGRRVTTASRRAASALSAIDEVRRRRAQQQLEQAGAVLTLQHVQIGPRMSQPFPAIQIDSNWRGRTDDLRLIGRITDLPSHEEAQKWMLILDGPQVTDEWVGKLGQLKNVIVIELKNAAITDGAMEKLVEMPELQFLSIMYCDIGDQSIPHLSALKNIVRIKLFGTDISAQGNEKLKQQLATVEVDYRQGGFLGIGCEDNPCRVTTVRSGTAADRAGLQFGDIITHYRNQPVNTMDELTRLIAQDKVGERVAIEIQRDGQKIVTELTLGEWD